MGIDGGRGRDLSEFLTYAEAAELLDKNPVATRTFLNKHHVPRYVRREDVMLAKAAAGQGRRQDRRVDGGEHFWDRGTREEDISGEPLIWCARKGCGVGVVLHDDETVTYRRRLV
jgi:hypothetical protein